MSNLTDCPNCETEIDATSVSLTGYCPDCETPFSKDNLTPYEKERGVETLLDMAQEQQ